MTNHNITIKMQQKTRIDKTRKEENQTKKNKNMRKAYKNNKNSEQKYKKGENMKQFMDGNTEMNNNKNSKKGNINIK